MDFYFVNSNNRKIDFTKPPFLGVMSNDLFQFEWDYITQGQAVQRIVKFEKRMKKKTFQVLISGDTSKEYRENLDRFLQLTDVDINNLRMGRLYVGDYYLECYCFASGKQKQYVGTLKTLIDVSIICENGNWQSDEKWIFRSGNNVGEGETTGNGILYPYDYETDPLTHEILGYDYSAPFGRTTLINESYLDTDFEMIIYGAIDEKAKVTVGGNDYIVYCDLEPYDYLTINSRRKIVEITRYDGTKENVFKDRERGWNIFEKIKSGGNLVILNENMSMDITLFYERSEPFWGDQKWT